MAWAWTAVQLVALATPKGKHLATTVKEKNKKKMSVQHKFHFMPIYSIGVRGLDSTSCGAAGVGSWPKIKINAALQPRSVCHMRLKLIRFWLGAKNQFLDQTEFYLFMASISFGHATPPTFWQLLRHIICCCCCAATVEASHRPTPVLVV